MKHSLGIKEIKHLAFQLHISIDDLCEMANDFSSKCREFEIIKKYKKRKIIDLPKRYKDLNKKVLSLLEELQTSQNAFGWKKNCSTKDYVSPHKNNPFKICLDLKNCFPSISSRRVHKLFEKELNCSPAVATILTKLTTHKFKLAQGFPTSGVILNLIMRKTDSYIEQVVSSESMTYTRYGDDITISGKNPNKKISTTIKNILKCNGFILNDAKEIITYGDKNPKITGLACHNGKVIVSQDVKKKLRAKKHHYSKIVPNSPEAKKLLESIYGLERYIKSVEN